MIVWGEISDDVAVFIAAMVEIYGYQHKDHSRLMVSKEAIDHVRRKGIPSVSFSAFRDVAHKSGIGYQCDVTYEQVNSALGRLPYNAISRKNFWDRNYGAYASMPSPFGFLNTGYSTRAPDSITVDWRDSATGDAGDDENCDSDDWGEWSDD